MTLGGGHHTKKELRGCYTLAPTQVGKLGGGQGKI